MRECCVHTSHPHGAMALQYGRIPCIHGRIFQLYGRIRAHPFRVYGRMLIIFVANFDAFQLLVY